MSERRMRKSGLYPLDVKKHGIGGALTVPLERRKQDRIAEAAEGYAVVFFPKYHGIGKAQVNFFGLDRSLSRSPEAAKIKFMDGMKPGEKWETYHRGGHRIRKVRVVDLGDA